MWPGPYGEWGSRKYLLSSLDQSLGRMGLDYVDIFYSHRPDPETPMEETMGALDYAVRSGKALYAGISSYTPEQTIEAARILKDLGTPLLIHQPSYSMLNRWTENGTPNLYEALEEVGAGSIAFSPLAQGMLTDRYLVGIPADSRAAKQRFLPNRPDRGQTGPCPRAEQHRRRPRAITGADGHRLDPPRPAQGITRHLRPGRCIQRPATGRHAMRHKQPRIYRRGTRGHRRIRSRIKHHPSQ